MTNNKFTKISEIGEFNLIRNLVQGIKTTQKSTKMGIGDDAAVINFTKAKDHLISTDMLVEGVHFNPNYCPLKHVGYKAIIVNISDICAMNGHATHALISLAIPTKYSVELITDLYSGIRLACENYNIDLVGGDTTASTTGLIISITIIGESKPNKTTYRSGAKPGDLLVVSGDLGGAYLGLQILERENTIFEQHQKSEPILEQYSYILEKQLKPEATYQSLSKFMDQMTVKKSERVLFEKMLLSIDNALKKRC